MATNLAPASSVQHSPWSSALWSVEHSQTCHPQAWEIRCVMLTKHIKPPSDANIILKWIPRNVCITKLCHEFVYISCNLVAKEPNRILLSMQTYWSLVQHLCVLAWTPAPPPSLGKWFKADNIDHWNVCKTKRNSLSGKVPQTAGFRTSWWWWCTDEYSPHVLICPSNGIPLV